METFEVKASASCTFVWTLDLGAVAALYDVASAVIRLQAKADPDQGGADLAFITASAASGEAGQATFNATTKFVQFTAPQSAVSGLRGRYQMLARLETSAGFVDLFDGELHFRKALIASPTNSASGSALNDTVLAKLIHSTSGAAPLALTAATALGALASISAAQVAAAVAAALAPGAINVALEAWKATLPTSEPTTANTFWMDGGFLACTSSA